MEVEIRSVTGRIGETDRIGAQIGRLQREAVIRRAGGAYIDEGRLHLAVGLRVDRAGKILQVEVEAGVIVVFTLPTVSVKLVAAADPLGGGIRDGVDPALLKAVEYEPRLPTEMV